MRRFVIAVLLSSPGSSAYLGSPVERTVCAAVGAAAPVYRDCLIGGKLGGDGFLERHVGCLDFSRPMRIVADAFHRFRGGRVSTCAP